MKEYILSLLTGLLIALVGMALFAAAFFLGGVVTFNTMRYFHISCVLWPETNPPEYNCDNMGYVVPVLLGGLAAGLLTVLAYSLVVWRLRRNRT